MAGYDIDEILALDRQQAVVRVPPETNVPLTPRVRRLIDTPEFNRLRRIGQLGVVELVYPGARHSRFEHTLGVYYLTLQYLRRLGHDTRFRRAVTAYDATTLLAAALVHDLGHYPFCHPIEDLRLPGIPSHEALARRMIGRPGRRNSIARMLRDDWGLDPDDVLEVLKKRRDDRPKMRLLRSILSGPIDVDKMDYLQRDSLHAGVPYGRHFDPERLIASLAVNEAGDGLALTEKGKTAAELMVFARYVMFSEVYWHHAVRAATAMMQRAMHDSLDAYDHRVLYGLTESEFIAYVRTHAAAESTRDLLDGLFGPSRRLYKRVHELSRGGGDALYDALAGRPYPWLVRCANALARRLKRVCRRRDLREHELLIDAPPVGKEVEFKITVYDARRDRYAPFEATSPVLRALAHQQFDHYVKRVRILCSQRLAGKLPPGADIEPALRDAIEETDEQHAGA
jgi:uncharacterized protein